MREPRRPFERRALVERLRSSAVMWSWLSLVLRGGAAVILLPIIVRKMPPEQLGLWYIFVAFGTALSVFDVSFSPGVSRAATYFWAGSSNLKEFGIAPIPTTTGFTRPNTAGLMQLMFTMNRFYVRACCIGVALISLSASYWVWKKTASFPNALSLCAAGGAYLIAVCLNLVANLWLALLTGINEVKRVQQVSVLSLVANYAGSIFGLFFGLELWALVIGNLLMGIIALVFAKQTFFRLMEKRDNSIESYKPEIIKTLWPNGWRGGMVHIANFMILNGAVLMCSAFFDLQTTGSFGFTFQAAMILVQLSCTWTQVKWPIFNHLRANGQLKEIAEIFSFRVRLSLLTYVIGAIGLMIFGPWVLNIIQAKTTLLPFGPMAIMLLFLLLQMQHSQYELLVLSENCNPFVGPYLFSAIVIVFIRMIMAPHYGVLGILVPTIAVQSCFNHWWPIVRAVRGLGYSPRKYFKLFIFGNRLR